MRTTDNEYQPNLFMNRMECHCGATKAAKSWWRVQDWWRIHGYGRKC
jgi:hypothetical protein